jgi:hypothetical protein
MLFFPLVVFFFSNGLQHESKNQGSFLWGQLNMMDKGRFGVVIAILAAILYSITFLSLQMLQPFPVKIKDTSLNGSLSGLPCSWSKVLAYSTFPVAGTLLLTIFNL